MLGRTECARSLIFSEANVRLKNKLGWTPLAEAISYGNRYIVKLLVFRMQRTHNEEREKRIPVLSSKFMAVRDFQLTLKWDFHSWVPFLSRYLPSDVCKVYKKGNKIRLDSTLLDFRESMWQKGDVSFIFNATKNQPLLMLDNVQQVVHAVKTQYNASRSSSSSFVNDAGYDVNSDLHGQDYDTAYLMAHSIISASLDSNNVIFTRTKSGYFSSADKKETVGKFQADSYTVNNLILHQKKRKEHLPVEKREDGRSFIKKFGNVQDLCFDDPPPPPANKMTWFEYINAPVGQYNLGRPMMLKESSKAYKAYVSMSQDFPLSLNVVMDLLELMAPMKHFSKLRNFLNTRLPPGFPVKIEIPILPTITATAMFTDFEWNDNLADELFVLPKHYRTAFINNL
ncbi:hypothetical protein HELRODRAFT_108743 [Helobdella robusta]|uniref:Ankyrin repeat domain-containing protein n=1 Tax=Helobdella robusta TaxID=6412 RepID=T1EEM1_HELRO|nr:hypothetical protein HELRODRAFT_108743 [Helobdella robusta]ESN90686.1 hypothetical protein HELRODRAFT_108743 [Helobdella robusta]